MVFDIKPLIIGGAAMVGAILGALLGWLDSGEPFNARKFAFSIVHALIAGLSFAIGYQYKETLSTMDVIIAIVAGAGTDAVLNRVEGAIVAKAVGLLKK